jgi:hypothetical protein
MKPREKVTNERASEYDISIAFPLSAVTLCKPQQKWANQLMGMLWSAGN